ncbi:MAG TPA: amylo-alpha-1,6-glucosidase [Roseiflexaceae bacterium]|nr:amylo-alpha-1,6-glucosidase [Roseiflexaceae bacterium]
MQIDERRLVFGPYQLAKQATDQHPGLYMLGGRCTYLLGQGDGSLDPIGVEHLVGAMGGLWVHPYRITDGIDSRIEDTQGNPLPISRMVLEDRLAEVCWSWQCGDLLIERRDTVAADTAAWVMQLTVRNTGSTTSSGMIRCRARIEIGGAWFSAIAPGTTQLHTDGMRVVAAAADLPGFAVVLGAADRLPLTIDVDTVQLAVRFQLAPAAEQRFTLLVTASHAGHAAATADWHHLISTPEAIFGAQQARYAACYTDAPLLASAATDLARDFALARANLILLTADYPDLGAYFLAGLPEYPQLFGCDTTYSIAGAFAAGHAATARHALEQLAAYAARACGRVPHEITTNGRVFHPGNIQETPQFTIALWDYLRWTGDTATVARLFAICREGMNELLPAMSGGGFYPYGDGMVERLGMGSRKLDSACYTYAALHALAQIAEALGDPSPHYRQRAEALRDAFEHDWWIESEGMYGDSMQSDGTLRLDGHWTVVLPAQLGLASPERTTRLLDRIEREWVNQWGLVHTRDHEELVWTLPTGLLALAAFAAGRNTLGMRLTQAIALTAQHGALGTFKELIPQGLCFVQLWSAALYIQALVEGLLGISPLAHQQQLKITPHLPDGMSPVTIRGLLIGAHAFDLTVAADQVTVHHSRGDTPFTVFCYAEQQTLAPGTTHTFVQHAPHAK